MHFKRVSGRVKTALTVLVCNVLIGACDSVLLDVEFENDPVGNFDALWHEFDRFYAFFGVRHVNWDSLYTVYRPRVYPEATDQELYDAMTGLLSHLEDHHVSLAADGFPRFSAARNHDRPFFPDSHPDSLNSDVSAMYRNAFYGYLDSVYVGASSFGLPSNFSGFGTIGPDNTQLKVGYIAVYSFNIKGEYDSYFAAVADAFVGYDGVIIDIRDNPGGYSSIGEALAGLFTNATEPYALVKFRGGPGHDDFASPGQRWLEPNGGKLEDVSVAVLTSRFSTSAAELFTLSSRVLPDAIVVGDTTAGAFGSVIKKILPNGWEFTLSGNLVSALDGTSYEGIGYPPDIRVLATRAGIDQGIDATIDAAIAALETGNQAHTHYSR